MPGKSNRSEGLGVLSEALMVDTVAAVMRIVRDQQAADSVTSAQTAWLVHKVLSTLAEKEGNHDTNLRIPEAKFSAWASAVQKGLRRQGRLET
ncbi:hypothetical protein AYO44_10745 [Planctomycetaceae bacterium SCGC AG-212-F19]|nr:hypothetical protein AYO44_10745 [Planctomycetaceae bacterium SCGC AG-212-F19]